MQLRCRFLPGGWLCIYQVFLWDVEQAEAEQDQLPHHANASEIPTPHWNTACRKTRRGKRHLSWCTFCQRKPMTHSSQQQHKPVIRSQFSLSRVTWVTWEAWGFTDKRGTLSTFPCSTFLMLKEEDLASRHHPTVNDLGHLFFPTFLGSLSLFSWQKAKGQPQKELWQHHYNKEDDIMPACYFS